MAKIVIESIKDGPIRAVLEMEQDKLDQFLPRERNALLARCLEKAVLMWRGLFMRVWFSKAVLDPPYLYQLDRKTPLVDSGEMARLVYTGQIKAVAPGGNVKCTVSRPTGHPIKPEIARVLQVVPPDQIQYVADRFAEFVARGIDSATIIIDRRPDVQPKRRLTVRQRRSLGVTARKASRAR